MRASTHEPLLRVVKRAEASARLKITVRLIAVLLALIVDALFIFFVTGLNPAQVYVTMFQGTFSTSMRFSWAMRDLASLLLIGIALAPAFKMRFWNTGAEGQVLMGALATAAVMVYYGNTLPSPLLFAAMLAASIAAGALWGFIPAWFKAHFSTNETLFTLMMNYVAIQLVACCVNIWRGQASGLGKLNMKTKAGWFPQIMGQRYTINLAVVILLTVAMYCYLRYSKHGYEIAVVGESENTARYAGINVGKVIIRTMIISGALCGLTGFLIVGGRDQTISTGTAGGNGFTAIIVAWLAKFNTFTMALISFLLIFLDKGAAEIASAYNLNDYASDIIAGIILFFILGSEFFINYKVILHRGGRKEVC
ncbi:MAG: ABC transporter permease [Clostridia bacterium]|nr:ABC transporter permease [Clostridia bacterium]